MAKYTVTYADGVTGTVNIVGPVKDRQRKADWYSTRLSPEGYKKQQEELRQQENVEAKQKAESKELPKLQGSDKQIAWAEKIRIEYVDKLDDFISKTRSADTAKGNLSPDEYSRYLQPINDTAKDFRDKLLSKASASWWIDNRGKPLMVIYKEVTPELFEKHTKLNAEARNYLQSKTPAIPEPKPYVSIYTKQPDPPKQPELEPKPKPQKQEPAKTTNPIDQSTLEKKQADRTTLSQASDKAKKHSIIITPDDPRAKKWIKDPGTMDILGVDSPASVTKATVKPKQPKFRAPKPPKAKSPASPKNKRVGKYYVSGGAVSRKPIGKRRR